MNSRACSRRGCTSCRRALAARRGAAEARLSVLVRHPDFEFHVRELRLPLPSRRRAMTSAASRPPVYQLQQPAEDPGLAGAVGVRVDVVAQMEAGDQQRLLGAVLSDSLRSVAAADSRRGLATAH